MKRTLKRTDGTEEVLEGTAEELAEHERRLREAGVLMPETTTKKPEVLQGKSLGEQLEEWFKMLPKAPEPPVMPWDSTPCWHLDGRCSQCHCAPCICTQHYSPLSILYKTNTLKLTD